MFSAEAMRGLGILAPETVIKQALLAGVCFHAYQQARSLSGPVSKGSAAEYGTGLHMRQTPCDVPHGQALENAGIFLSLSKN